MKNLFMFQNPYGFTRGTICVVRMVDFQPVALRIEQSKWFTEWHGCFSII